MMSNTPIPGMNDATEVTAPHRIALGNPKMKNPSAGEHAVQCRHQERSADHGTRAGV